MKGSRKKGSGLYNTPNKLILSYTYRKVKSTRTVLDTRQTNIKVISLPFVCQISSKLFDAPPFLAWTSIKIEISADIWNENNLLKKNKKYISENQIILNNYPTLTQPAQFGYTSIMEHKYYMYAKVPSVSYIFFLRDN